VAKRIGHVRTYFDGFRSDQETTFGQDAAYTDDEIEHMRCDAALPAILDCRTLYNEVKVERKATLVDEDVYVVKLTPKRASAEVLYVSCRTGLIVQHVTTTETF
jgi:hypothetical protein